MSDKEQVVPQSVDVPEEQLKAMTLEDQTRLLSEKQTRADMEALMEAAQKPVKGANSAMVIPTSRGFFDLDDSQRAELLTRPKVYVLPDDVVDGELDEDQVVADGPWMAVALENGEWITGELVGIIADSITLRKIHSLDDDGITYWDTTVETARCVVWHTLEGDRWSMPSHEGESTGEPDQFSRDPLTGFPRRNVT